MLSTEWCPLQHSEGSDEMLLRTTELGAPEKAESAVLGQKSIYPKSRALGLTFTKNELRRLEHMTDTRLITKVINRIFSRFCIWGFFPQQAFTFTED